MILEARMGTDGKMDVQLDVSNGGRVSRLEVIEGPTGRRSRSAAEKARIAAESLMPEAQVATIARKYGVTRWQVYDWRRRFRQGQLGLPDGTAAMFTPLMVDDPSEPRPAAARAIAKLEIRVDDVVIRTEVEADRLADVIRAVRASR
jgi:transposase